MQTSGIFRTHRTVFKTEDEVQLVPFGDVHFGCVNHAGASFKRFLKWAKSLPNPLFFGMGDYFDALSASERRIIYGGKLHDQTIKEFHKNAEERQARFLKLIDFMEGRLLGALDGNHEWIFENGESSTKRLATSLGGPHLGVCTLLNLTIQKGTVRTPLTIYAHHGKGAGATLGGSLNGVAKQSIGLEADIYLMGHDHKMVGGFADRLLLASTGGVKDRPVYAGRTGSFLKGYPTDTESYPVDAGYSPSTIGGLYFRINQRTTPEHGTHAHFEATLRPA